MISASTPSSFSWWKSKKKQTGLKLKMPCRQLPKCRTLSLSFAERPSALGMPLVVMNRGAAEESHDAANEPNQVIAGSHPRRVCASVRSNSADRQNQIETGASDGVGPRLRLIVIRLCCARNSPATARVLATRMPLTKTVFMKTKTPNTHRNNECR